MFEVLADIARQLWKKLEIAFCGLGVACIQNCEAQEPEAPAKASCLV